MLRLIKIILIFTLPGASFLFKENPRFALVIPLLFVILLACLAVSRQITTVDGIVIGISSLFLIHFVSVLFPFLYQRKLLSLINSKVSIYYLVVLILTNITIAAGTFYFKKSALGIELYYIPSTSMFPTLKPGDIVLADTWFKLDLLKVGDVIIFQHPQIEGMHIVKRISSLTQNSVRVLGDNPRNSLDSRTLGDIPKSLIAAKATAIYRDMTFKQM